MSEPRRSDNHKLSSDRIADIQDALETLYIRGNLSGRLKFAERWPEAARYVFGPELSRCDHEGAADKARRSALEDQAEDRRRGLLDTVVTLEEKSAEKGVLKTAYVEGVVKGLGRNIALLIYSDWIVDRFVPASAAEIPVVEVKKVYEDPAAFEVREAEISPELSKPLPKIAPEPELPEPEPEPENAMDAIKPISVEPPPVEKKPVAESKRKTLKIFGIKESPDKGDAG